MKQIRCEMCGSSDLIKQDGVFVCQNCGIKYSVEEAKKMLVEVQGSIEFTGTVKLDSTDKIENLLIRAKQFEEENNLKKALEYYNKILDIDATNPIAKRKIIELASFYIGTVEVSKSTIDEIDRMMANNMKLQAVKYVIDVAGLGLADAKAWVENYKTVDLMHPQKIGTSPTTSNKSKNKNGNNTIKTEGGCYIATCVYGSYDCPQVWTLRRFRDNTLGSTWYGRAFIRTYYAVSPMLVKWFGKTDCFRHFCQRPLDKMVKKLNRNGVEDIPYQDKVW